MTDLEQAKALLTSCGHTCALCQDGEVLTSRARGVRPLVNWLESGAEVKGWSAADKVVGKATAFLYVLLGVRAVYAGVISQPALEVLLERGIDVRFDALVPNIINRQGDGICPFEAAVFKIDEPHMARIAILSKMQELGITL